MHRITKEKINLRELFLNVRPSRLYLHSWLKEISLSGRVLEVGCGTGEYHHFMDTSNCTLTGFDAVPTPVVDKIGDFNKRWPFDDSSYNSVLSINSFCFAQSPHHFISESARVLTLQGNLIIYQTYLINCTTEGDLHDIAHYSSEGMHYYLGQYFERVVTLRVKTGIFMTVLNLLHPIFGRLPFVYPGLFAGAVLSDAILKKRKLLARYELCHLLEASIPKTHSKG